MSQSAKKKKRRGELLRTAVSLSQLPRAPTRLDGARNDLRKSYGHKHAEIVRSSVLRKAFLFKLSTGRADRETAQISQNERLVESVCAIRTVGT